MKAPRYLFTAGLSAALVALAAGSASAATISPPSADFGGLVIGNQSVVTFTVTVQSGERCRTPGPTGVDCYPIQPSIVGNNFAIGKGLIEDVSPGTNCHRVRFLTATTPSCTITMIFKPTLLGHYTGVVFPNDYDPEVLARTTGTGLLSRKNINCRSKKKGGIRSKLSRWCENRQK